MEERYVKAGGLRLRYVEKGMGKPLLYVHGNTGSLRWFDRLMDLPGWRTIALDMPNFGRSEPLAEEPDIDRYADAVLAFMEALELHRPCLVGHSLGGAVAISIATRRPSALASLILVDSAAPSGLHTPPERHPVIAMMRTNRELLEKALRAVAPTIKDEAFFQELVEDARLMAEPAWVGNAVALGRMEYGPRCRIFTEPVLVLRGDLDSIVTEAMARETASAFPEGRFVPLAGVGHSVVVEDPARFLALL